MSDRDIVYVLNTDGLANDGEELRYSLRSVETNLPHRRVMFLGFKPGWARNVEHIPWPNHPGGKWHTLMSKLFRLPLIDGLTDVVYAMGDDFYVTEPVPKIPPLYTNTLAERAADLYATRTPSSKYAAIFENTLAYLEAHGAERLNNHQLHVPQVLELAALDPALAEHPKPLGAASVAGNLGSLEPVRLAKDFKVNSPETFAEWKAKGTGLLSANEKTFHSSGVAKYLAARFPDPSIYEAI